MSWKDSLRKASFRGIAFFVDAHSADFGRRTVQHEYPLRDVPYSEDLGRKQQGFSVEAYVIGDDYFRKRDALISACEKGGRGKLIHPYFGKKFVVVTDCKVSENVREGRMARFSITFLEAGERKFPAAKKDFISKLKAAAENLNNKIQSFFEKVYAIAQMPQDVLDNVKSVVTTFSNTLQGIEGNITGIFAEYIFTAKEISSTAASLIMTPVDLAKEIIDIVKKIPDIFTDSKSTLQAFDPLLNFGGENFGGRSVAGFSESNLMRPPTIPNTVLALGVTPTRTQEAINIHALANLIKQVAIAEAVKTALEINYSTYEDAIAQRDKLLEAIDDQINQAGLNAQIETMLSGASTDAFYNKVYQTLEDDDVYQALQDVRKSLIEAIPTPDTDLPSLVPYENQQTQPSLVLTYSLYEALSKEEDLIQRNHVAHPGFVPGGVILEVIRES